MSPHMMARGTHREQLLAGCLCGIGVGLGFLFVSNKVAGNLDSW